MFKRSRSFLSCGLALVILTNPAFAWYNAQQGRFLQRDPSESGQPVNEQLAYHGQPPVVYAPRFSPDGHYRDGMNLFEYLRSNPANSNDPMGLFLFWDILDSTSARLYANLAVASAAGAAGVLVADLLAGMSLHNAAIEAACFGAAAFMGGSVGLAAGEALFGASQSFWISGTIVAAQSSPVFHRSVAYLLQDNKLHHIWDEAAHKLAQFGSPEALAPRIIDALIRSGQLPKSGVVAGGIRILIDGVVLVGRGYVDADGVIKTGTIFVP